MTIVLQLTPAEFAELQDKHFALPDSLFAVWVREKYDLPDVIFEEVHIHITGPLEVKVPRGFYRMEGIVD